MKLDHLSASQIKTWLMCPMKYRLTYLDKVPWAFKPAALVFGTAIHSALETFYRAWMDGERLPLMALEEEFNRAWDDEPDDIPLDTDNPETIRVQGQALLEVFHSSIQPQNVVAVEEPFEVPLVDPATGELLDVTLKGRFDLIEADADGIPVIVDHKSLSKRPGDTDLQHNIQLRAYAYASRRLGLLPEEASALMRMDVLLKTKTPGFESRYWTIPADQDAGFFTLAVEIVKAIRAEVFPPNPGWGCSGCPVARCCPYSKH